MPPCPVLDVCTVAFIDPVLPLLLAPVERRTSPESPAPAVPGVLIAEEVYLAEAPGASPTASAIAEADG